MGFFQLLDKFSHCTNAVLLLSCFKNGVLDSGVESKQLFISCCKSHSIQFAIKNLKSGSSTKTNRAWFYTHYWGGSILWILVSCCIKLLGSVHNYNRTGFFQRDKDCGLSTVRILSWVMSEYNEFWSLQILKKGLAKMYFLCIFKHAVV